MKQALIIVTIIIAIVGIAAYATKEKKNKQENPLTSYFEYSEEEKVPLLSRMSEKEITIEEIYKWKEKIFNLVSNNKLGDKDAAKVYAYFFLAQREAAYLSYQIHNAPIGDLHYIATRTICEILPQECDLNITSDAYTVALTAIITEKIQKRITEDNATTKPYPIKTSKDAWNGPDPKFGIEAGSWVPWFLTTGSKFRVPPPSAPFGSPAFTEQLHLVKTARTNITETERQATILWAGGPGTKTPPGQWMELASKYMQEKNTSLATILQVNAHLAMTIQDAVIAVFDSKYTYFIKRPFMVDSSILTIMPTPNHPSYPAGHSTISSAAATILNYYFPENKIEWDERAKEAGSSRVWGGIHFPQDDEQGNILGENVAKEAIRQFTHK